MIDLALGLGDKKPSLSLDLYEWEPKPVLMSKTTEVHKPRFPVIDFHNHLRSVRDWDLVIEEMDAAGVVSVVNLDGGYKRKGSSLVETLSRSDAIGNIPDSARSRVVMFSRPFSGATLPIHSSDFVEKTISQIEDDVSKGAKGLKISKRLGLNFKDIDGDVIRVDDEALDPIWKKCAELNIPVLIHSADPKAFFQPFDRFNERWLTLAMHPQWRFTPPEFPSYEEVLEQRDNLIEHHPKTTFVGAHIGSSSNDLNYISSLMDRNSNFYVDISARILELGRQPRRARKFFLEYHNRILFGTDIPPNKGKREYYRISYRFLETDDEYFLSPEGRPPIRPHCARPWFIYGINLPDKVLKNVYYGNAKRLIPDLEI